MGAGTGRGSRPHCSPRPHSGRRSPAGKGSVALRTGEARGFRSGKPPAASQVITVRRSSPSSCAMARRERPARFAGAPSSSAGGLREESRHRARVLHEMSEISPGYVLAPYAPQKPQRSATADRKEAPSANRASRRTISVPFGVSCAVCEFIRGYT
jgi:hypothetical protein